MVVPVAAAAAPHNLPYPFPRNRIYCSHMGTVFPGMGWQTPGIGCLGVASFRLAGSGAEAMLNDERVTKDRLTDRFGLTSAEADLAAAFLCEGSLRAAAKRRGLTDGTARQYLNRIFRKTDTNSQVKLMKLLLLTLQDRAPAACSPAR